MDNKIVMISIAAVIGIIVLGSVLMPILDDSTATTDTFTNEGYFNMSKVTADSEDVTIHWDYTNPYVFDINGVDTELPFGSTTGDIFPYTIMCSDGWGIRATIYNSGVTIDLVLFGNNPNLIWYSSTSDGYNVTFKFSAGTFTVGRDGGTTATQTYTEAYHLDKDGAYTMKKGNVNAYLNEDSEIYATGRTSTIVTGVNMNINVKATIEDGANVTLIYPTTGYTVSNESVNANEVNSHKNLYSFSNVTFDVTGSDGSGTATYGQVIVPHEVTAERSVHFTAGQNAIFAAIPVMIILAVLLGVVALVIRSRMD